MTHTPPEWMQDAACRHASTETFFPDRGEPTDAAKAICNGDPDKGTEPCAVRATCLAYALDNREVFGVWGGLSELERRILRRGRRTPATPSERATCGTASGYRRHRRRGESACESCREANRVQSAESWKHRREAS